MAESKRTKPHRHLIGRDALKSGWPELSDAHPEHTHKVARDTYLFGIEDSPVHRHETRSYKGEYYGMSGPPVEERD